ncbi:MAG: ATP-binding protein [Paracoccaceae bacterium]|nr:ATP-binding protein [Paracoccaceae bacterium]
MIAQLLKASLPRSLFGRATLILLVPVLSILAVVSVVIIQRLYSDVTAQMTRGVADEIRLIIARLDQGFDAAPAGEAVVPIAEALSIRLTVPAPDISDRRSWYDWSGRTVSLTLREELEDVRAVDLVSVDGAVLVSLGTQKGPIMLEVSRNRFSARNPHQFLVLIGFTAFLMVIIALLYLRGQVRPIRRLAAAATAFGKGRVLPYRPSGAAEVREAGQAFIEMRDRIERQMEQRTLMLSGVSHDLRTPLTRIKLALSMMPDDQDTADARHDVDEMEKMLDGFLDFARSDGHEGAEQVGLTEIMEAAEARARRAGLHLDLDPPATDLTIRVRPLALARAIDNLVSNAVSYGTRARLAAAASEADVRLVVEDDGPGIPVDQRDAALQPFTRLDFARNQDRGSGVGLGLAIAADIARQHGGALKLGDSAALGGLRAEIILPV